MLQKPLRERPVLFAASPSVFRPRAVIRRRIATAVAAAILGIGPGLTARSDEPEATTQALVLLGQIRLAEGDRPAGSLSLSVQEWRGEHQPQESLDALKTRLTQGPPTLATGSFLFRTEGWFKTLTVPAVGKKPPSRTRTAEGDGNLRILVEATIDKEPRKIGRVSSAGITAPGDALLSGRVARTAAGILFKTAQSKSDLIELTGTRGSEKHTMLFERKPARVVRWELVRELVGPGGERQSQTYACQVQRDPASGAITQLEEWVVNPPPSSNAAFRRTAVTPGSGAPATAEAVRFRFPSGTVVTDTRGEVPVEYVQTDAGVSDEGVASFASAVAAGRVRAGDIAPALELKNEKGKPVRLADFKGRLVVLYWFEAGSDRAVAASAFLMDLQKEFRRRKVELVAIAFGEDGQSGPDVDAFRKKAKWTLPVYTEENHSGLRRFGDIVAVPKIALITPEGKIAYVQAGLDPERLLTLVDSLAPPP